MAAVPNTNTDEFTVNRDTGSVGSICFGGVDNLVFVGSVHLVDIRIVLCFLGFYGHSRFRMFAQHESFLRYH